MLIRKTLDAGDLDLLSINIAYNKIDFELFFFLKQIILNDLNMEKSQDLKRF